MLTDFNLIKNKSTETFVITWDLGRRCNLDCSYCPSHRHDNFSKPASFEELKQSLDFIGDYIRTIGTIRVDKSYYISLTGGEPTVNPNFTKFAEYVQEWKKKLPQDYSIKLDLTTNGIMSEKILNVVIENFDHVTVSYHAEADETLKKNMLDRILQLKDSGINFKVNVMMHARQFEETVEFCNTLKQHDIRHIPRPIGEDPDSPLSTAHKYTDEQKQWFSDYFNIPVTQTTRPCCGGRSFTLCSKDKETDTKVINFREFKGWSCSVNWYFLHIEQQTGFVYHHQTCQATLDNKRGSIGSLDNTSEIIDNLINRMKNPYEPIICPNKLCGCGLCVPKSKDREDYIMVISNILHENR